MIIVPETGNHVKKINEVKTMKLKTGILMMMVGIAMIGLTVSSVSAYAYTAKCKHTPTGNTHESGSDYLSAQCDLTWQGGSQWNWHTSTDGSNDNYGTFYDAKFGTYAYAKNTNIQPYPSTCCYGTYSSYAFAGEDQWEDQIRVTYCT